MVVAVFFCLCLPLAPSAHLISYPVDAKGSFPWEQSGQRIHLPALCAKVKNAWSIMSILTALNF